MLPLTSVTFLLPNHFVSSHQQTLLDWRWGAPSRMSLRSQQACVKGWISGQMRLPRLLRGVSMRCSALRWLWAAVRQLLPVYPV